jgi:hypothetical protein
MKRADRVLQVPPGPVAFRVVAVGMVVIVVVMVTAVVMV